MKDSLSKKLLSKSLKNILSENKIFSELLPFDEYHLVMAQTDLLDSQAERRITKTYFYRKPPFGSSYSIAAGITAFINKLESFDYSLLVPYLERMNYDARFIEYAKKRSHLKVEIFSLIDNSPAFPNEPIISIRSNLIDSRLIEGIVLSELNFASLIATKWHRIRSVCGGRPVMEFGRRRAQNALKASLYSYYSGIGATSNCEANYYFGIPTAGTMGHEFVQSYDDEFTAFDRFLESNPNTPVLLVDTINTINSGLSNAIRAFKKHKTKLVEYGSWDKIGVRIDSGDLAYLASECYKQLATELDNKDVNITLSNDLDEHKIESIMTQLRSASKDNTAKHLSFGVGTRAVTAWDEPALGGICKVSQIDDNYILKLSNHNSKTTYPGETRSAIVLDDNGEYMTTLIYLSNEELSKIDTCLHPDDSSKFMKLGGLSQKLAPRQQLIYSTVNGKDTIYSERYNQSLDEIKNNSGDLLNTLDWSYHRILNPHLAKVSLSKKLYDLRWSMIRQSKIAMKI